MIVIIIITIMIKLIVITILMSVYFRSKSLKNDNREAKVDEQTNMTTSYKDQKQSTQM